MMGKVKIDVKELITFRRCLDQLRRSIPKAGHDTMKMVAVRYEQRVRKNYLTGGAVTTPLHPGTLQRRAQGKRAGKRPAFSPKSGVMPLGKSLFALVQSSTRGGGSGKVSTTRVRIRVGVPMSGGATSERVAAINEFGETHTITSTPAMRTYLRALALGVAGTDEMVAPKGVESITILIRIPARPVWTPALLAITANHPKMFARKMIGRLQKENPSLKIVMR